MAKGYSWKYGKLFKKIRCGDQITFFIRDKSGFYNGIVLSKIISKKSSDLVILSKSGEQYHFVLPTNMIRGLRLPIIINGYIYHSGLSNEKTIVLGLIKRDNTVPYKIMIKTSH